MAPFRQHKPKLTDDERHKRFVDMAKKVGASENEEDFIKALRSVLPERPAIGPASPRLRSPRSPKSLIASSTVRTSSGWKSEFLCRSLICRSVLIS